MGRIAKSKITFVNREVTERVDTQSGEVIDSTIRENTQTILRTEPPFVKLYLDDLMYIADLPKKHSKLVYALLKRSSYADAEEGLCVNLTSYVKTKLLTELGWENSRSLNNGLSDLVKGQILKRMGGGTYQFNPFFFGRGDWKSIESIRVNWDYNRNGKSFSAVIAHKSDDDRNGVNEENGSAERETSSDSREANGIPGGLLPTGENGTTRSDSE